MTEFLTFQQRKILILSLKKKEYTPANKDSKKLFKRISDEKFPLT